MRKKILIIIFDAVILLTVGAFLWRHLQGLPLGAVQLAPLPLGVSLIFPLLFFFNTGLLHHAINRVFGLPFTLRTSVDIYMGSLLAAYIPGRAFVLLKRHVLAKDQGASFVSLLAVFFTEALATILGALIFFVAVSLPFARLIPGPYLVLTVVVFLVAAAALHPRSLNGLYIRYQRWKGRSQPQRYPLSTLMLWKIILGYALNWIFYAVGMMMVLRACVPESAGYGVYLAGMYALAGVIGTVAFVMPNGLGIREGVALIGFSAVMSPAQAALCSVLFRVWNTAAEILCVLLVKLFLARDRKRGSG